MQRIKTGVKETKEIRNGLLYNYINRAQIKKIASYHISIILYRLSKLLISKLHLQVMQSTAFSILYGHINAPMVFKELILSTVYSAAYHI